MTQQDNKLLAKLLKSRFVQDNASIRHELLRMQVHQKKAELQSLHTKGPQK